MGPLKSWWRRVRPRVLSRTAFTVSRLIGMTLRLKVENAGAFRSLECGGIVCGWHGRSLIAANYFRRQGVWVMISHSRDGEMQNRIFSLYGFNTIRGSTGRGGVRAAIEAIRVLRKGALMAMTPDGPRGPSGIVQPGVMTMAQKSGAALIPVGISARPRWLAPTWDRYLVPYPFAKAVMVFGEPLFVPENSSPEQVEEVRLVLEAESHRLEAEAESRMGY